MSRCSKWKKRNGSSGRTRTYNPPVNSCTDGKTANYRQLLLTLKTRPLRHFQERLSTANSGRDSLKKSPKYFPAFPREPTLCIGPSDDAGTPKRSARRKTRTRRTSAVNTGTTLTRTPTKEAPNGCTSP